MLTRTYIGVLNIKGKHNYKLIYYKYIIPKGRTLMKMYRVVPVTKIEN